MGRSFVLTTIAAVLLVACGSPAPLTANPTSGAADAIHAQTKLAAVMVRADWCASCKILEPKVLNVRQEQRLDGLTHIVLDHTERNARDLYAQADAAGVGKAMREEFAEEIITGMLYLVDVDDQRIVGDARNPTTEAEIKALIARKLNDA